MRVGVVGGDGKKTLDVFKQIEDSGIGEVVWHIPAREKPSRLQKVSADVFICLLDYCGHQLNECTKTRANELGAVYRTLSISKSVNVKKLEELMHYVTQAMKDTVERLFKETGVEYVSARDAIKMGVRTPQLFEAKHHVKRVPFITKAGVEAPQFGMVFYAKQDVLTYTGVRSPDGNVNCVKEISPWQEMERDGEKFESGAKEVQSLEEDHEIDEAIAKLTENVAEEPKVPVNTVAAGSWIKDPVLMRYRNDSYEIVRPLESGTDENVAAEAELVIEEDVKKVEFQQVQYSVVQLKMTLTARRKIEIVRS